MLASSVLWASFLMGVLGGPHCLLMCAGACAALCQSTPEQSALQRALSFQVGRLLGYGSLGAIGAASMQTIGALSKQLVVLQPLWNFIHVLGLVSGLYLLLFAFQPLWLDQGARRLWRWTQSRVALYSLLSWRAGPFIAGVLWALLPCGLLYSALMMASLTASPLSGCLSMMSFTLGSALSLWAAQWGFNALQKKSMANTTKDSEAQSSTTQSLTFLPNINTQAPLALANRVRGEKLSRMGFRVCGLALLLYCAWLLYNDTILQNAPWCSPSA
jgi:sulfite exporter TauE/SafE